MSQIQHSGMYPVGTPRVDYGRGFRNAMLDKKATADKRQEKQEFQKKLGNIVSIYNELPGEDQKAEFRDVIFGMGGDFITVSKELALKEKWNRERSPAHKKASEDLFVSTFSQVSATPDIEANMNRIPQLAQEFEEFVNQNGEFHGQTKNIFGLQELSSLLPQYNSALAAARPIDEQGRPRQQNFAPAARFFANFAKMGQAKAAEIAAMRKKEAESLLPDAEKPMTPYQKESLDVDKARIKLGRDKLAQDSVQQDTGIDVDSMATAVADQTLTAGQIPKRGKVWSQVVSKVKELNPKFNFQYSDANYKWFTSSVGTKTINMLSGSMPRVAILAEQAKELPNSTFIPYNKAKRWFLNETGSPVYSGFDSNVAAIVQEVNAAISGTSQGSDHRVKIEMDNLKSSRSTEQLRAAIDNLMGALSARLDASMTGPFPKEVVNGEMSMPEYRKYIKETYGGNYTPHTDPSVGRTDDGRGELATGETRGTSGPSLDVFLEAARKANPTATDADLKAYWEQKYGMAK